MAGTWKVVPLKYSIAFPFTQIFLFTTTDANASMASGALLSPCSLTNSALLIFAVTSLPKISAVTLSSVTSMLVGGSRAGFVVFDDGWDFGFSFGKELFTSFFC